MRKPVELSDDIFVGVRDLYQQATVERSHYYTAGAITDAINEITAIRKKAGLSGVERNKRSRLGRPPGWLSVAPGPKSLE